MTKKYLRDDRATDQSVTTTIFGCYGDMMNKGQLTTCFNSKTGQSKDDGCSLQEFHDGEELVKTTGRDLRVFCRVARRRKVKCRGSEDYGT